MDHASYKRCDPTSKAVIDTIVEASGHRIAVSVEDFGRDRKVLGYWFAIEAACREGEWFKPTYPVFPYQDVNIERAKATRNWLWESDWITDYFIFNRDHTMFGWALHEHIVPWAVAKNTWNCPNECNDYEEFVKMPRQLFSFWHLKAGQWVLYKDYSDDQFSVDSKIACWEAKKSLLYEHIQDYRPEEDGYAFKVVETGDHPPKDMSL